MFVFCRKQRNILASQLRLFEISEIKINSVVGLPSWTKLTRRTGIRLYLHPLANYSTVEETEFQEQGSVAGPPLLLKWLNIKFIMKYIMKEEEKFNVWPSQQLLVKCMSLYN